MKLNYIENVDCMIGLKSIPDKSVDLILADLPYGTTQNKWDQVIPLNSFITIEVKGKNKKVGFGEFVEYCIKNALYDNLVDIKEYWDENYQKGLWFEYERIIKDNGAIVLTSAQPFTSVLISSNRKLFKYSLVWNKKQVTGFLNSKKQPLRRHEDICVFYKKPPTYNPQMSIGKEYSIKRKHSTNNYGEQKENETNNDGKRYPTSIIDHVPQVRVKNGHPTQKPVKLGQYLIRTFSNVGDIVLDNTFGSGAFLKAAILENRNFIGFEIDPYWFKKLEDDLSF